MNWGILYTIMTIDNNAHINKIMQTLRNCPTVAGWRQIYTTLDMLEL